MPDLGAGEIAAIVAASAAAAQTGNALANAGGGGGIGVPDVAGQLAEQQSKALQSRVGRTIPEAASRGLGGASPDFLANLTATEAGFPQGGVQALDVVQQYLRSPGAGV